MKQPVARAEAQAVQGTYDLGQGRLPSSPQVNEYIELTFTDIVSVNFGSSVSRQCANQRLFDLDETVKVSICVDRQLYD